jgi:hypothetical protein
VAVGPCPLCADNAAAHIQAIWRGHAVRKRAPPLRRRDKRSLHVRVSSPASGPSLSDAPPPRGGSHAHASSASSVVAETGSAGGTAAAATSVRAKLAQLKAEKSSLKQQLRTFDARWAAEHGGRQPSKADKEHLRPHYQRYHDLKGMITTLEQGAEGQTGRGG